VYIDNILIYSQSQEEYTKHVKIVLEQLQDANFQVDISKSEFNITRTKYLGLIVLTNSIKIDLDKIKVIQE
jgi:ribosome-interacting GTPase 1